MDEQQKQRNDKLVLDVMEFADVLQGKDESQLESLKADLTGDLKDKNKEFEWLEKHRKSEITAPLMNMGIGANLAGLVMMATFPEGVEAVATLAEATALATSAVLMAVAGKGAMDFSQTNTGYRMDQKEVTSEIEGTEAKMALLDKALDGEEIDLSAIKDVTGEDLAPTVDRLSHERNNGQTR